MAKIIIICMVVVVVIIISFYFHFIEWMNEYFFIVQHQHSMKWKKKEKSGKRNTENSGNGQLHYT